MFFRLTTSQVPHWWPLIVDPLRLSMPPFAYGDPERLSNILFELMAERIDCWILATEKEELIGFVLTTFSTDQCSHVKNLLIYCLYGGLNQDTSVWLSAWETVKQFAKDNQCHRVVAYTGSKEVASIAKSIGFQTSAYLTYEV